MTETQNSTSHPAGITVLAQDGQPSRPLYDSIMENLRRQFQISGDGSVMLNGVTYSIEEVEPDAMNVPTEYRIVEHHSPTLHDTLEAEHVFETMEEAADFLLSQGDFARGNPENNYGLYELLEVLRAREEDLPKGGGPTPLRDMTDEEIVDDLTKTTLERIRDTPGIVEDLSSGVEASSARRSVTAQTAPHPPTIEEPVVAGNLRLWVQRVSGSGPGEENRFMVYQRDDSAGTLGGQRPVSLSPSFPSARAAAAWLSANLSKVEHADDPAAPAEGIVAHGGERKSFILHDGTTCELSVERVSALTESWAVVFQSLDGRRNRARIPTGADTQEGANAYLDSGMACAVTLIGMGLDGRWVRTNDNSGFIGEYGFMRYGQIAVLGLHFKDGSHCFYVDVPFDVVQGLEDTLDTEVYYAMYIQGRYRVVWGFEPSSQVVAEVSAEVAPVNREGFCDWVRVAGQAIDAVCYKPGQAGGTLRIRFRNGGVYQYEGVPEGVFGELTAANGRPGAVFQTKVRNVYPTVKIPKEAIQAEELARQRDAESERERRWLRDVNFDAEVPMGEVDSISSGGRPGNWFRAAQSGFAPAYEDWIQALQAGGGTEVTIDPFVYSVEQTRASDGSRQFAVVRDTVGGGNRITKAIVLNLQSALNIMKDQSFVSEAIAEIMAVRRMNWDEASGEDRGVAVHDELANNGCVERGGKRYTLDRGQRNYELHDEDYREVAGAPVFPQREVACRWIADNDAFLALYIPPAEIQRRFDHPEEGDRVCFAGDCYMLMEARNDVGTEWRGWLILRGGNGSRPSDPWYAIARFPSRQEAMEWIINGRLHSYVLDRLSGSARHEETFVPQKPDAQIGPDDSPSTPWWDALGVDEVALARSRSTVRTAQSRHEVVYAYNLDDGSMAEVVGVHDANDDQAASSYIARVTPPSGQPIVLGEYDAAEAAHEELRRYMNAHGGPSTPVGGEPPAEPRSIEVVASWTLRMGGHVAVHRNISTSPATYWVEVNLPAYAAAARGPDEIGPYPNVGEACREATRQARRNGGLADSMTEDEGEVTPDAVQDRLEQGMGVEVGDFMFEVVADPRDAGMMALVRTRMASPHDRATVMTADSAEPLIDHARTYIPVFQHHMGADDRAERTEELVSAETCRGGVVVQVVAVTERGVVDHQVRVVNPGQPATVMFSHPDVHRADEYAVETIQRLNDPRMRSSLSNSPVTGGLTPEDMKRMYRAHGFLIVDPFKYSPTEVSAGRFAVERIDMRDGRSTVVYAGFPPVPMRSRQSVVEWLVSEGFIEDIVRPDLARAHSTKPDGAAAAPTDVPAALPAGEGMSTEDLLSEMGVDPDSLLASSSFEIRVAQRRRRRNMPRPPIPGGREPLRDEGADSIPTTQPPTDFYAIATGVQTEGPLSYYGIWETGHGFFAAMRADEDMHPMASIRVFNDTADAIAFINRLPDGSRRLGWERLETSGIESFPTVGHALAYVSPRFDPPYRFVWLGASGWIIETCQMQGMPTGQAARWTPVTLGDATYSIDRLGANYAVIRSVAGQPQIIDTFDTVLGAQGMMSRITGDVLEAFPPLMTVSTVRQVPYYICSIPAGNRYAVVQGGGGDPIVSIHGTIEEASEARNRVVIDARAHAFDDRPRSVLAGPVVVNGVTYEVATVEGGTDGSVEYSVVGSRGDRNVLFFRTRSRDEAIGRYNAAIWDASGPAVAGPTQVGSTSYVVREENGRYLVVGTRGGNESVLASYDSRDDALAAFRSMTGESSQNAASGRSDPGTTYSSPEEVKTLVSQERKANNIQGVVYVPADWASGGGRQGYIDRRPGMERERTAVVANIREDDVVLVTHEDVTSFARWGTRFLEGIATNFQGRLVGRHGMWLAPDLCVFRSTGAAAAPTDVPAALPAGEGMSTEDLLSEMGVDPDSLLASSSFEIRTAQRRRSPRRSR